MMTHMTPRITITADDVRALLRRFDGWKIATGSFGGWEGWGWHGKGVQLMIPVMPDAPTKADYQTRLWEAVRDAGVAMGIGTDIYVYLGVLLHRRLEATMAAIASNQTALGADFEAVWDTHAAELYEE